MKITINPKSLIATRGSSRGLLYQLKTGDLKKNKFMAEWLRDSKPIRIIIEPLFKESDTNESK